MWLLLLKPKTRVTSDLTSVKLNVGGKIWPRKGRLASEIWSTSFDPTLAKWLFKIFAMSVGSLFPSMLLLKLLLTLEATLFRER